MERKMNWDVDKSVWAPMKLISLEVWNDFVRTHIVIFYLDVKDVQNIIDNFVWFKIHLIL